MKDRLTALAKRLLHPVVSRVWDNPHAQFTMQEAMQRLVAHNFPIRTVIDLGASDGRWSVETMKFLPKASYLGVDPLMEREAELKATKESHPNFDYVIAAAGRVDTTVSLAVSEDLDGSTVGGGGANQRQVDSLTLDTLIAKKGLSGPYLLKFDTHGFEEEILLGASKTLENTSVIIMEVYNFKISGYALRFHEICAKLETLGFRCYDMANPLLRAYDRTLWQMDMLFCRADHPIFSKNQYR